MKLDYLENVNEWGDKPVRIYDFDSEQANLFRQAIQKNLVEKKSEFNLDKLVFIQPINLFPHT